MRAYTAKDLRVAPISAQDSCALIKRLHYSGKTVNNSQLHLGVFLGTRLEGAMSFGPSLDRRKLLPLVRGTLWNEMLELNRMAFSENLPRNSESRAIAVAMRILRRDYSHVQWVVSFADATQCGDGTIYRASGFVLTGIQKNKTIWAAPSGETITDVGSRTSMKAIQTFSKVGLTCGSAKLEEARARGIINKVTATTKIEAGPYNGSAGMKHYSAAGFRPLEGYQLRYVYFLHPTARERLTVRILPFSTIDMMNARMYRGKRVGSIPTETPVVQTGEGGSTPTPTLQTT